MLNHDMNTAEETTETPVKFIRKLNSQASDQMGDRSSSTANVNEGKNPSAGGAPAPHAGNSAVTESLTAKNPALDRRPGGGCIPVSGLDR